MHTESYTFLQEHLSATDMAAFNAVLEELDAEDAAFSVGHLASYLEPLVAVQGDFPTTLHYTVGLDDFPYLSLGEGSKVYHEEGGLFTVYTVGGDVHHLTTQQVLEFQQVANAYASALWAMAAGLISA